jgi:hypothetical protein
VAIKFGRGRDRSVMKVGAVQIALVLPFVITACGGDVTGVPIQGEQFSPLPVYATWWAMTEACSGLSGSLGGVTFYKTTENLRNPITGELVAGYWYSEGNRIVLREGSIGDGGTVRHEMLHALIKKGGHPRDQFLGKCSGTADCIGSCITDAGPYPTPPENPIQIGGESLQFGIDIEPRNPTVAHDGGYFSITVLVKNPSSHWATVAQLSGTPVTTFSFEIAGPNGALSVSKPPLDPSEITFAPGETKKHVFDFFIGDAPFGMQLPVGSYVVRGGYDSYESGDSTFVIGP